MNILLATIPLMVAIIMLAVLQRSGLQTGLATLAAAVAIALAMPSFRLAPDCAQIETCRFCYWCSAWRRS